MTREIPQIKPSDTHRRTVRALLRASRCGSLATTQASGPSEADGAPGGPYASLVTHATLPDASPVFLLSELAEHTQNLLRDPRAAFLVEQASVLPNPQTGPRATLTGTLRRVSGAEADRARARFLARHPGAALYAGFGDFSFWVMQIERIHFVGGFARAVWIEDGPGLPPALCANLEARAGSACDHMNTDHADAVALLARHHRADNDATDTPTSVWKLLALDADGMDIGTDALSLRIPFPTPLSAPDDLQPTLVAMLRALRAAPQ
ncbi:HugZ family pyridoxamine 5'-phosphate oxidase [Novispirillum itersonii]|uniref:HugZ family pyridoxamine 5'-phosphate oxidase n=1 Tax=Novispirillum itersonii TaxID=189 RepID=UPI0003A1A0FF|nr:DUF2470 domain-containing protein [Novispirillum itersonii]